MHYLAYKERLYRSVLEACIYNIYIQKKIQRGFSTIFLEIFSMLTFWMLPATFPFSYVNNNQSESTSLSLILSMENGNNFILSITNVRNGQINETVFFRKKKKGLAS